MPTFRAFRGVFLKRILLFILPILIIVAAALVLFGVFLVRFEEDKLLDDLLRKSRSIAEGMELSAQQVFLTRDRKSAEYLVQKFERRERLQGCVLYDRSGELVAVTPRFYDWASQSHTYVQEALATGEPRFGLEKFKELTVYTYVFPVSGQDREVLGLIEIIYDTSFVFARIAELWLRLNMTLAGLIVFIFCLSFLLHRRIFVMPVLHLTEWFRSFQRGELTTGQPIRDKGELGKLASEVEQVALSLRVARRTISSQAQDRITQDEIWTEEKLRDLTHAKLGDNALFVVSNREPFMHVVDEKSGVPRCVRPASGVVTGLHPILAACGGTWIAHGAGTADRNFVNSKNKLGVPPDDIRYILKRVWLTKEEEGGYYYGFANEGLWPLCHNTHTRPIFRAADWQMYQAVNRKFAAEILEELPVGSVPFVFIQDYHFTLLGRMIKEERPDAIIALFWHIPWPTGESFSICPYHKEILEGMLGCDLIGFHVQNHCNNFLETANRLLESRVDTEKFSVVRKNKETLVRAFPISVDPDVDRGVFPNVALSREAEALKEEYGLQERIIGLGVDRIDYTKGIVERILAIDRFLEKYPQYRSRFVFVQLAAPSRTHIKRYHDLVAEIDELVEKKNWKYQEGSWVPILYLKRHFSQEEILPFYKLADLCIVSSLHDGMNLVAKEYIVTRTHAAGSLVLSRFTGAARELTDAVLINPYSIEECADAIRAAIEMPAAEKEQRMQNMRRIITKNNIYSWAASIVSELTALKKP